MRRRRLVAAGATATALLVILAGAAPAWATPGAFDTTFSGDGVTAVNVAPGPDLAGDVAIQSDGKIVVAGEGGANGNWGFEVIRLLQNGKLDPTYSGDG